MNTNGFKLNENAFVYSSVVAPTFLTLASGGWEGVDGEEGRGTETLLGSGLRWAPLGVCVGVRTGSLLVRLSFCTCSVREEVPETAGFRRSLLPCEILIVSSCTVFQKGKEYLHLDSPLQPAPWTRPPHCCVRVWILASNIMI